MEAEVGRSGKERRVGAAWVISLLLSRRATHLMAKDDSEGVSLG